jgi:hypothetical protein
VIASLEKLDAVRKNKIDQAMLLGDSPRPAARELVLEWFWLAGADEWISHHCLDEIEQSQSYAPIGSEPEPKVLTKFQLKDAEASRR